MHPDVTALALALAAALFILSAAALAVREWRLGVAGLILGAALVVLAAEGDLAAPESAAFIGAAAAPLLAPIAAWACVRPRPLIWAALACAVVAGPLRTLLYDPFYDPLCLTACPPNPLALVHVGPSVHTGLLATGLAAALSLALASVWGPNRLILSVLAVTSATVAAEPALALEVALVCGALVLVLGGSTVARRLESRARLTELARALDAAVDIETSLRGTTGDPGLTISYQLEPGWFFDRAGRPDHGVHPEQTSVDIIGPQGVVARVHHDAKLKDLDALGAAIVGPARVALDNGRLEAQVHRHASQLEASRRRIVVHADAERRRLERDLHDGAQQHLLALGLTLQQALDSRPGAHEQDLLHRCLATTHLALSELRDLSHGFYPASLHQTGLHHAMDGVVDRSPVPLTIRSVPEERLPADVERALYLLVSRIASAARRPVAVTFTATADSVEVTAIGSSLPTGVIRDVFAVLGGSLVELDGARTGTPGIHGTLPLVAKTPVNVT